MFDLRAGTGRADGSAGNRRGSVNGWEERTMSGGKEHSVESPPTVMEAVRLAEGYLARHGIDTARLSAEHLLAKALGCTRLDLYLRFDERLGPEVLAGYRQWLRRRSQHVPLQYILGKIEFYSLPFRIDEGVFVPRPETELLVERIETLMGSREEAVFLEFGVGSGVIAGSLAARHPGWSGVAFDISQHAAALASHNFAGLGISDRIAVFVAGSLETVEAPRRFDLLVSNPPYIPTEVIPTLQKEVAGFEDSAALDGGPDGTVFYPLIAGAGAHLLRPGGLVALEIGDGQGRSVERILSAEGYERIGTGRDYNGLERTVIAYRPDR